MENLCVQCSPSRDKFCVYVFFLLYTSLRSALCSGTRCFFCLSPFPINDTRLWHQMIPRLRNILLSPPYRVSETWYTPSRNSRRHTVYITLLITIMDPPFHSIQGSRGFTTARVARVSRESFRALKWIEAAAVIVSAVNGATVFMTEVEHVLTRTRALGDLKILLGVESGDFLSASARARKHAGENKTKKEKKMRKSPISKKYRRSFLLTVSRWVSLSFSFSSFLSRRAINDTSRPLLINSYNLSAKWNDTVSFYRMRGDSPVITTTISMTHNDVRRRAFIAWYASAICVN